MSDFARRLGDAIRCAQSSPVSLDDAAFNDLALALFHLQFEQVVPYRQLCERRKCTPDGVQSWRNIPAVPTTAFKELELTSLPAKERTTVFHSSGTTEQRPSRHFHSSESLVVYETSLLPWFRQHVLPELTDASQRTPADWHWLALTPPPSSAPNSSLIHMLDIVQREYSSAAPAFFGELSPENTWEIRFDEVIARLQQSVTAQQPVILLGTAFLFVHLLDKLEHRSLSFTLPAGSRVMETGGYKGRSRELPKAELHRHLSARLGIADDAIICEYGMSELSSQAYDRVCGNHAARRLRFPPWARTVVISPETGQEVANGETGLVRIHDLANVWSVGAIQTEDLAIRHADGLELLGRTRQAEPRGCSLMAG